jgi:hypothetical protein
MTKIKNLFYLSMATVMTSSVFATDLSERINNASKSVEAGGNLAVWLVGAAGIVLLFMGIMGLKKYADDARSNPLMKPMIYILAGGLMTGFTAFRNILANTATGEDSDIDVGQGTFSAGDTTTP